MSNHDKERKLKAAKRLRREAGAYLRKLRHAEQLTQLELAHLLGYDYVTFISQLECGGAQIPPDRIKDYAEALKTNPKTFAKTLLRYYEPQLFNLIFGKASE
ncbi:MAG: transcriptional regulator [Rhodospirillaceae bacterium]|nr:MAG: transcriptional regulator [Rhodospirillaceae bacterium]